jgi:5-methylthioadenosine/S-adenosylhomocysteine deaminase
VEMLRNGVTAVHDDAFYNPWPTRPAIDAVMSAYRDSGLRATVAINHQNLPELDKLPFLADILPPDIRAEVDAIRIAPLYELTGLYPDSAEIRKNPLPTAVGAILLHP